MPQNMWNLLVERSGWFAGLAGEHLTLSAIAIAVATEVPGCRVWAVEADEAAARLAASNIASLAPGRVELLLADATDGAALAHLDGSADVVVSNSGALEDLNAEVDRLWSTWILEPGTIV